MSAQEEHVPGFRSDLFSFEGKASTVPRFRVLGYCFMPGWTVYRMLAHELLTDRRLHMKR